jgi:hypothetical protein
MALSRNAARYCCSPKPRSHVSMSIAHLHGGDETVVDLLIYHAHRRSVPISRSDRLRVASFENTAGCIQRHLRARSRRLLRRPLPLIANQPFIAVGCSLR